MRPLSKSRLHNESGFTLVEMAVVILIGGILMAMFGGAVIKSIRDTKVKTTQSRLKDVNEALRQFASSKKMLPCAASRIAAPAGAGYGIASCGAVTGTVSAGSGVRIGMVPTRTLNLPDEDGYDAWGSRFVYAVTESLTNSGTFNVQNGAISIIDSTGASVIDPEDKGTYVVLSVGPDRQGGYRVQGSATPAIACNATAGKLDAENCDDDATFRATLLTSDASTGFFDDFVVYGSLQNDVSDVPDGAILAFQGSCPKDWKNFVQAEGRMIIGTGRFTAGDYPPSAVVTAGEPGYAVGSTGGWTTRRDMPITSAADYKNMPPVVAYTYCIKDGGNRYIAPAHKIRGLAFPVNDAAPLPPVAPPPPPPVPPTPPPPPPPPPPSGSSRVICTHFYRRKRLSHLLWRADLEFTFNNLSGCAVRGYHVWAIPAVRLMRRHPWTEAIFYPLAISRAEEIAYQMGLTDKPNYAGKLIRLVMEPLCFLLGIFVPKQDWKTIYQPGAQGGE